MDSSDHRVEVGVGEGKFAIDSKILAAICFYKAISHQRSAFSIRL
jgi:hypothetical protein